MTVPPPPDDEAPEFSADRTFGEARWRNYAIDSVGYRKD